MPGPILGSATSWYCTIFHIWYCLIASIFINTPIIAQFFEFFCGISDYSATISWEISIGRIQHLFCKIISVAYLTSVTIWIIDTIQQKRYPCCKFMRFCHIGASEQNDAAHKVKIKFSWIIILLNEHIAPKKYVITASILHLSPKARLHIQQPKAT